MHRMSVYTEFTERRRPGHDHEAKCACGAYKYHEGVFTSFGTAGTIALFSAHGKGGVIEGLGSIRLAVRDLERSIEFYGRGLRFASSAEYDDDVSKDLVRLTAGTLCIELVRHSSTAPVRHSNGRGVSLSVSVRGLDAYHDALVERGLEPNRPRDSDGDGGRSFSIVDPDGYVWRFTQSDR